MNFTGISSLDQKAAYLRTLPAIRERCGRVFDLAKQGHLEYFDYHPEKEDQVAAYCVNAIKRDYGTDFTQIKPHSRWRHLDYQSERVAPLIAKWDAQKSSPPDVKEKARRLIDLFMVSVLLDAGAGNEWSFTEASSGKVFSRSEGLAVASISMFENGFFSGDAAQPHQVDAEGLSKVTPESTAKALQVGASNPIVALEGRAALLVGLSKALKANPTIFGKDGRPGNLVDFLEKESKLENGRRIVPIAALWHAMIEGLNSIWPSRYTLGGVPLGDVWPCPALKKASASVSSAISTEGDDFVPFHKLTGWLTYSLVEAIQESLGWEIVGIEDMTGLPEYRNGGLMVDLGVLTLKPNTLPIDPNSGLPHAPASHPAVVEWRALTVILLDRIADLIRAKLGLGQADLSLAQVLEGATWKCGREVAKEKRPATGGPPIVIDSDGTVF